MTDVNSNQFDTGEFLALDAVEDNKKVIEKANRHRVDELEAGIVDMIQRIHSTHHRTTTEIRRGLRKKWSDCRFQSCRTAQHLLHLPPFA